MGVHCELGHEIRENTDHHMLDVEERSNTNQHVYAKLYLLFALHHVFFLSIEIKCVRVCVCVCV